MAAIATKPASEIDFETLVHTFNNGYSGYTVPVNIDAHQLRHHIEQNDIDLAASHVGLSSSKVIGVALLGIRADRGWIGGLGVSPDHRRQGIGRLLMEAIISSARQHHLRTVQLEVITDNTAAHELYLKLGFADTRCLLILEQASATLPTLKTTMRVEFATATTLLDHHRIFQSRANPWQRAPLSLKKSIQSLSAWQVTEGDSILAYVIGQTTDSTIQIWDTGFKEGHEDALQDILIQVHQHHPTATGRLLNMADDDPAWPILQALGYQIMLRQHEMALAL